jgi:hypothetical protein
MDPNDWQTSSTMSDSGVSLINQRNRNNIENLDHQSESVKVLITYQGPDHHQNNAPLGFNCLTTKHT